MKNILYDNKKRIILFIIIILFITFVYINYTSVITVFGKNEILNENIDIVLGGETVGIKLLATGVLVIELDRNDVDLSIGDVILKVNGNKIETNQQLQNYVVNSKGDSLNLEVSRKDKIFNTEIKPKYDELSKEYKIGLWVKDSSAGVGTITFYDRNSSKFAALGHAVTETKENYILPITSGGITITDIYEVKKGLNRYPGELKGTITNDVIGSIMYNTQKGIYGNIYEKSLFENKDSIEILRKHDIKEGIAHIYTFLDDDEGKLYEIKIEKVLLGSVGNKNMIIKVVDENLIKKTGGIIQGMSGSPIIQDNKLIGAVTHVFLNDPTRGYGVFIENMIEDMYK